MTNREWAWPEVTPELVRERLEDLTPEGDAERMLRDWAEEFVIVDGPTRNGGRKRLVYVVDTCGALVRIPAHVEMRLSDTARRWAELARSHAPDVYPRALRHLRTLAGQRGAGAAARRIVAVAERWERDGDPDGARIRWLVADDPEIAAGE